jgi:hypothetical protein
VSDQHTSARAFSDILLHQVILAKPLEEGRDRQLGSNLAVGNTVAGSSELALTSRGQDDAIWPRRAGEQSISRTPHGSRMC